MKKKICNKNKYGFSIIELLIAGAIGTSLMLWFSKSTITSMKFQKEISLKNEISDYINLINLQLTNSSFCNDLLIPNAKGSSNFISTDLENLITYVSLSNLPPLPTGIAIDSTSLVNTTVPQIGQTKWVVKLLISLRKNSSFLGSYQITRQIPLMITTLPFADTTTKNLKIESCVPDLPNTNPVLTSGFLCGAYSTMGQGQGTGISINCSGMSPKNGCPSGYSQAIICDDDGHGGCNITIFCSSNISLKPDFELPIGTLCGWASDGAGSARSATMFSGGVVTSVNYIEINCGDSSPKTRCPTGYTRNAICDDQGSGGCNYHYFCASNNTIKENTPPGTLCGLNPWRAPSNYPYLTKGVACHGNQVDNGCPEGYSRKFAIEDTGVGSNNIIITCVKD